MLEQEEPKEAQEAIKTLRLQGRVWNVVQFALLIAVVVFFWLGMSHLSVAGVVCVLLIGWFRLYMLHTQEIEQPYYRLWLSFVDSLLFLAVLGSVFIQSLTDENEVEILLAVGCVFLLARIVGYTAFAYSVLREGKSMRRKAHWSKFATLAIIITMLVYLLDLDHYKQICMVATLLLMGASTVAFLYWYYRDPEHRKPLSIASQLTMSRIVLTPFFLWIFFYDGDLNYANNNIVFKVLALLMVLGFMLTDYLDGHLARKWGEVSTLGKYLDPFSDKISNMTIFMSFIAAGYAPVWMVALIYFREASIETLRTLAAAEGLIMPARYSGKVKTAIQGIGIVIILAGSLDPVQNAIPALASIWSYIPPSVMGIITTVTILSGVDYFMASQNILKKYV